MSERLVFLVGVTSLNLLFFFVMDSALRALGRNTFQMRKTLQAIIFGLASIVTIQFGLELGPGIYFDLRGAVIGLACFVGGWSTGVSATIAALVTRWCLGGEGMPWGLLFIALDFIVISTALRLYRRGTWSIERLVLVGILVGCIEASTILAWNTREMSVWNAVYTTGFLFLLPCGGTIAVGQLFLVHRSRGQLIGKIKESEARFRRLVEQSPDLFYQFSTVRGALYFSPQLKSMLGFSVDDMLKNPFMWRSRVHPEDLERKVRQVAEAGPDKTFEVEYRFQDATGRWRWLRDRSIGISESHSERIAEGLITDITELRLRQRQFDQVFNLVPELVCEVDAEGHFIQVNPVWQHLTGYTAAEISGHTIFDFIHPEDWESTRKVMNGMDPHRRISGFINRYRNKGGGFRHIEWTATQMPESAHLIGIGRDITKQIMAAARLHEAHQRLNCLINNIPDPLWLKDADGRYLAVNEAWRQMMNIQVPEVVGLTSRDLFPPELADRFEREERQMMQEGTPIELIEELHNGEGAVVQFEAWKRAVQIGPGKSLGTVGCARNLTARRQLEAKLTKYKLFSDLARDIILYVHPQTGKIIEANSSACEAYGYNRQQLLGLSVYDLRVDSVEMVRDQLEEAARNGARFEFDHRRRDGSTFPVEVVVHPVSIDGEALLMSVIRDITARRNLEEELRRLNAELGRRVDLKTLEALELYQNAPCGYHAVNSSGIVEQMNARELGWLGYSEEEVVGKMAFVDLLAEKDAVAFTRVFHQFVESGQTTTSEWRMRRKDGSTFPVFVTVQAIRDAEGRFIKTQTSVIDISERERIEQDLRNALDAAESAYRAKTAFLANISHELRTPLNAIIGFSELLRRDATLPVKCREQLQSISRSGQHLVEIIGDVLEMARIESGNVVLRSVRFELREVLEDLRQFFLQSTQEKGLAFHMEMATGNPPAFLGDVTKFRQVMVNLISNAVKFTDSGAIHVRLGWSRSPDGKYEISGEVEDTGSGIPSEEIGHLFQPFYQTELGYRCKGGTGLGLRITQEYLQRMGGDISVVSEAGRGSCFKFHFPIDVAISSPDGLDGEGGAPLVFGSRVPKPGTRVLVVDDQPDNRHLLQGLLEPLGYIVTEAVDGVDALEKVSKETPQWVLMDLRMPRMNGCDAIREIRRTKGRSLNIVAISAGVIPEEFKAARDAGADECLGKPFKDSELMEILLRSTDPVPDGFASGPLAQQGCAAHSGWSERIHQLPHEWILAMESAARNAEYRELTVMVDRISAVDHELASRFRSRLETFDYEAILEWIHPEKVERGEARSNSTV